MRETLNRNPEPKKKTVTLIKPEKQGGIGIDWSVKADSRAKPATVH
jgi:hypothetical protein